MNKPYLFRKIIATIIDYSILFIITYLYLREFGEANPDGGYSANGLAALPPIAIWFVYLPGSECIFGTSLGHFVVGLKVESVVSGKPDLIQAIKRRLADIVDLFFFGIPALISISRTENHQRLGDLWAETVVVKR